MSDEKFELSRRNALIGLGTVGAASAGAGLGTSAYFSDQEEFTGNMMTAGELDLAVDYVVHEDQGSAGSYTVNSITNEVNGTDPGEDLTVNGDGTAMSQNLSDVKPGDHGHSYFCFTIDDNPAYIWACGELVSTSENGYTEPEPEDDNGEGELEEKIEVDVTYCYLNDQGEQTDTGDTIFSGSLREVLERLQAGLPLDGSANGDAAAGDQAAFAGTSGEDGDNPCLCFDWELPTTVGNVIQGDSLEFDLSFHAVQSRHNDGAHNPCADETFVSEEVYVHRQSDLGFGNEQVAVSDINAASGSGATELRPVTIDVSYGSQMVVYRIQPTIGMEDPSNMAIGFDPEADGGAWDSQVLWQSGGTGFTYLENGGISDDPANVTGVSASYDSATNVFIVAIDRTTLEASSNAYRFAMQSIHEPGAANNPLNPSGSNARIDAELPSGFDWSDTSTWQDDTLA
ncbi:SipW-cognate class signal peptide [Halorubrum aquaticum]|uniref:SipW-cognate class signal peptide n=1 Tax=Halorubrum aquaticum TaxID=387340 RepID=A0A1I2Z2P1_9EURY|nr:SipW-dependent-type signal peptide-containing protein [Halorubrum aquaticum]SFH31809.1 SipW-cognate class signal peptide [Halorubrum aquaticum]